MAVATLPAIWAGAHPARLAEGLAVALCECLQADFVYTYLNVRGDEQEFIQRAQRGAPHRSDEELCRQLGPLISDWARSHNPDELLELDAAHFREPDGAGRYVTVRGLGLDCEFGVLAFGCVGHGPTEEQSLLLTVAANQAASAAQNNSLFRERARALEREQQARREAEALGEAAAALASDLDLHQTVQKATDLSTTLTGAAFGAFFYTVTDDAGESYMLFTLSGADREDFEKLGKPRNTAIFDHTFRGRGPLRIDDVLADERYGKSAPHHGMPKGHLPVRSYLAVPVLSRSRGVLGGMFFGHPEVGVFSESDERIAVGIAAQAAIAIDNARLYGEARRSEERFRTLVGVITDVPWTTDAEGRFIEPQPAWEAYTGQTWEQHRDFGWREALRAEDRPAVQEQWEQARAGGSMYEASGQLWHAPSSTYRHCLVRATPLRDEHGAVREWVGSCTDVDEQVRSKDYMERVIALRTAELQSSLERLQSAGLGDTSGTAALLSDLDTALAEVAADEGLAADSRQRLLEAQQQLREAIRASPPSCLPICPREPGFDPRLERSSGAGDPG